MKRIYVHQWRTKRYRSVLETENNAWGMRSSYSTERPGRDGRGTGGHSVSTTVRESSGSQAATRRSLLLWW